MSVGSTSNINLLNNPTLLAQMLPGVNIQGMAAALESELAFSQVPLTQIQQQQQTLTAQSNLWTTIANGATTLLNDAHGLNLQSDFTNATTVTQNSGSAYFTVSGGSGAPVGTYTVSNITAELPQIYTSGSYSSSTTALNTSGTITIDGTAVNVSSTDTLSSIAANINAAKIAGVSATVVQTTGGNYALSVYVNNSAPSISTTTSLTFGTSQTFVAGSYTLNGVTVSGLTSNTVTNAITGVTLNLLANSPTGSSYTFTVGNNVSAMSTNIQNLLNDAISLLNQIQAAIGKGGLLEGNATLEYLQNQILDAIQGTVNGNPALSLSYMGYPNPIFSVSSSKNSAGQYTLNMSVNTASLNSQLTSNWSNVESVINSVANQLAQLIPSYTGPNGVFSSQQSSIAQQQTLLTNQSNALQSMINMQQQQLQQEFDNLLTMMLASTHQSAYLTAMINNLSSSGGAGSSSSSGG